MEHPKSPQIQSLWAKASKYEDESKKQNRRTKSPSSRAQQHKGVSPKMERRGLEVELPPLPSLEPLPACPKRHFELSTAQSKLLVAPTGALRSPSLPHLSQPHLHSVCCSNHTRGVLLDTSFSSVCPSRPVCHPPLNVHLYETEADGSSPLQLTPRFL